MKQYIRSIKNLIQIGYLYLYHLILIRKIDVEEMSLQFEMMGTQLRHVISWKVHGCYKISVRALGISYPGSAKGISLKDSKEEQFLTLTFYGVFDKVEYEIPIYQSKAAFTTKFLVTAPIFSAPFSQGLMDVSPIVYSITSQEFAQGKLETVLSKGVVFSGQLSDTYITDTNPFLQEYFKKNEP